MSAAAKLPAIDPGLAALVDLLIEFAVDDFFAELEAKPAGESRAE